MEPYGEKYSSGHTLSLVHWLTLTNAGFATGSRYGLPHSWAGSGWKKCKHDRVDKSFHWWSPRCLYLSSVIIACWLCQGVDDRETAWQRSVRHSVCVVFLNSMIAVHSFRISISVAEHNAIRIGSWEFPLAVDVKPDKSIPSQPRVFNDFAWYCSSNSEIHQCKFSSASLINVLSR